MLVYSNGNLGILGYTDSDYQGDIESSKISYEENLGDLFTKTLSDGVFEKHVNHMGLRSVQAYSRVSGIRLHLCFGSKTKCNFIF